MRAEKWRGDGRPDTIIGRRDSRKMTGRIKDTIIDMKDSVMKRRLYLFCDSYISQLIRNSRPSQMQQARSGKEGLLLTSVYSSNHPVGLGMIIHRISRREKVKT